MQNESGHYDAEPPRENFHDGWVPLEFSRRLNPAGFPASFPAEGWDSLDIRARSALREWYRSEYKSGVVAMKCGGEYVLAEKLSIMAIDKAGRPEPVVGCISKRQGEEAGFGVVAISALKERDYTPEDGFDWGPSLDNMGKNSTLGDSIFTQKFINKDFFNRFLQVNDKALAAVSHVVDYMISKGEDSAGIPNNEEEAGYFLIVLSVLEMLQGKKPMIHFLDVGVLNDFMRNELREKFASDGVVNSITITSERTDLKFAPSANPKTPMGKKLVDALKAGRLKEIEQKMLALSNKDSVKSLKERLELIFSQPDVV